MAALVLDNGASSVKIGLSSTEKPRVIPNCIFKAKGERRKVFLGDQIDECKDYSALYYVMAFQKGFIVNWDVQKQLWDYIFGKEVMQVEFQDTDLLLTEPPFNFTSIKDAMDEILFEEYNFRSLCRQTAAQLSVCRSNELSSEKHLVCLVVDTGYSFTHIVPVYNGKVIKKAVRRINVGGKLLTNHLKEITSYRQLHVLDETYVMNQVKEDCCFVSSCFNKDMDIARKRGKENTIVRDYVLPDYTSIRRGYIKPVEEMWMSSKKTDNELQVLRMANERFSIPEILFHPSDIGIHEMGIAEAIVNSVSVLPKEMHPHFYKNILLTGGNVLFPGFKDRVYSDVRSLAPSLHDVVVHVPDDPITHAWRGGVSLVNKPEFKNMFVTKVEYEEHGKSICREKLDS